MPERVIIPYRVSALWVMFVCGLHVFAVAVLMLIGILWWVKIVAILAIVVNLMVFNVHLKRLKGINRLVLCADGIEIGHQQYPEYPLEAYLQGDIFMTPWLGVLILKCDNAWTLFVPCVFDAIDPEDFRRLRVFVTCRAERYRMKTP